MKHAAHFLAYLILILSGSRVGWTQSSAESSSIPASRLEIQEPGLTGFDKQVETRHFIIVWRTPETRPAEVETAKTQAESFFARISEYIGASRAPTEKLIVILEGEAKQQEGQRKGPSKNGYRVPHVDRQGRIHLYRYFGNYFEALSHEMVHAFRMQTNHWKDGFFEEGFASLIGDALQPDKKGFPRYGVPLTVVAGHWIVSAEDIPLMILKQQHRQISLKCMAQSYSLRASFFKYLQDQFG